MLDLKNLIKSTYVGVTQKESYTSAEVYELIEQTKSAFLSKAGTKIEEYIKEKDNKIANLQNNLESKNKETEEFLNAKKEYETKIADLDSKIANQGLEIKEYETANKINTAKTLLSGMVVKGAEVEVYDKIAPLISNHKFAPDTPIADRQAAIKSDLDSFIEKQPWFSPREVTQSDDKGLIQKTIKTDETKPKLDGEDIYQPTGNVLRKEG